MKSQSCRYYAVGDIHGRLDLTKQLISQIEKDILKYPKDKPVLVFLGDYIDRGPDSKGVIDILIDISKKYECVFLKGNHEDILLMFLDDAKKGPLWLINGGIETIKSYGIKEISEEDEKNNYPELQNQLLKKISKDHLNFFKNTLQLTYETKKYLFVHAGVRFDIPINKQKKQDLLWIREPFLSEDTNFGKIIVHGHSINEKEPDIKANRIGIDTGAYYTDILTCLVISGDKTYFINNLVPLKSKILS